MADHVKKHDTQGMTSISLHGARKEKDGGTRPLGILALEENVVQKAVAETILTPIYEAQFLGFSYGFRPGRGARRTLDALAVGIERRKIGWVVDCDIRAFFDNVSRDWLVRFLKHCIGDRRVIRLIVKRLNAGTMEDGIWRDNLRGTPQGSVISPLFPERSDLGCAKLARNRFRGRSRHLTAAPPPPGAPPPAWPGSVGPNSPHCA